MRAFTKVVLLFVCAMAAGMATTLFQGTFTTDDQVELFQFTLSADTTITIQSYGYAGGTIGATTIPDGGFAPYVTIFALLGSDYVQSTSDNGGHNGVTQPDPLTGNYGDPYLQITLPAGTYYLALSVWDNVPSTGILADGFKQTGSPGFTCAEGSASGQFCDVTDALFRPRTANWALTVSGADTITDVTGVPEPSTWGLTLSGGLMGTLVLRRKRF